MKLGLVFFSFVFLAFGCCLEIRSVLFVYSFPWRGVVHLCLGFCVRMGRVSEGLERGVEG